MERLEPSRRHRRRGRGSRKKTQGSLKNLPAIQAHLETSFDEVTSPVLGMDSDGEQSESLYRGKSAFSLKSPQSPNLKSLLTSRADTPMLGAQARAAELAAASAAKQRQVSRELEERQLLPNPAISLSAFTKPQPPTNRNKGNKTWKPLILEEIVESPDSADTSGPSVLASANLNHINSEEITDGNIPTDPRAVVVPSPLDRSQHSKTRLSPVVNMPASYAQEGYGPSHPSGFPHLTLTRKGYLPQPLCMAGISSNHPSHSAPLQTFGSMMVPDDISPTKQEEKLSMLENTPRPQLLHGRDLCHSVKTERAVSHPGSSSYSSGAPDTFGVDQICVWEDSSNTAYHANLLVPFQSYPELIGTNCSDDLNEGYVDQHILRMKPAMLTATLNNENSPPGIPNHQTTRQPQQPQPPFDSYFSYHEPYDTKRAMTECVNQLKEKARDGKTVLHNPNPQNASMSRHLPKSADPGPKQRGARKISSRDRPPVPWEVQQFLRKSESNGRNERSIPLEKHRDETITCISDIQESRNSNTIKPAPGLALPEELGHPRRGSEVLNKQRREDASTLGVVNAPWMRLAPLTASERDRVRRCMALAAKSVTNEVPSQKITTSLSEQDLIETQRWFHTDSRGESLLRDQVSISAQAYAASMSANIKVRGDGNLPRQSRDFNDDGLAATLILGNVACNLQTYLVGDRKSIEQRRNFYKVKSVPDWCTEKGRLAFGGLGGGDSYFDGATGGFYAAPVRVARDPRFRPQVKEGMKMKPEEEWKNRHEMYGRRII